MGLQENFRKDPVSELQIRDAVVVGSSATVRDAVGLMREANLGCAVVVDDHRKPIGILTESMVTELLSHGSLPVNAPVHEHMADRCPWVRNTDPVVDVLEAMQMKNIRMLCVVDDQDRVVGVTGQRGVMEYVAEHFPGQVMVQRVGQTPYLSDREGA